MKALIALLILGSIGTSASGTDMHLLRPVFPSGQQHSTLSQSQISGTASAYQYFGRGAADFGRQ